MSVTYPLAMPTTGIGRQIFEPQRVDFLSPEAGGRMGGMSAGSPLWSATFTLADMTSDNADLWTSFIDALDGPLRQFYGYDPSRVLPKAYPGGFGSMTRAGGGSFDGSASGWSVDGTRTVLTLTGLPANFVLSRRDYVGFRWTTSSVQRRALVRSVEAINANSSGAASITVRPALPTLVPGGATAYLNNPNCLMRQVPNATKVGEMDTRRAPGAQIVAIQDLLA